MEVIETQLNLK